VTAVPFAPGSVSLRLYPHNELPAAEVVGELRAQAMLGEAAGFAGLMVSEHHGGFAGYLPNPVQTAGFLLAGTEQVWVAPCPLLLPLRPAALVVEEIAWLAAAYPGRVGLGVAAGALPLDFTVMGLDPADAAPRFKAELGRVVAMLQGADLGDLMGDPALRRCVDDPVPVLSAAVSPVAARRAATVGAGILLDSMGALTRQRALTDAFREAGGTGACVAIRRVWLGPPPEEALAAQRALYESYSSGAAQQHWADTNTIVDDDPVALAERVAESVRAAGCDAVNLRVHMHGVPAPAIREQITALGTQVLPLFGRLAVPGHR
jgi:alkanesulfonate monooxygenase SsuD/methylene tetrahydromethanopterin reductase-like flavin-dependent oxidoreductase (luciferase family)